MDAEEMLHLFFGAYRWLFSGSFLLIWLNFIVVIGKKPFKVIVFLIWLSEEKNEDALRGENKICLAGQNHERIIMHVCFSFPSVCFVSVTR